MTRRLPGRCLYCGARTDNQLACYAHAKLPPLDPHHCPDVRRPLETHPDLPVLIFPRRLVAA